MCKDVRLSGFRLSWAFVMLVPLLAVTIGQVRGRAQMYTTFRSVTGTVTEDGEPLAGAVVKLENTRTLEVRSYITNRNGTYRFGRLYDDVDYHLRADYRGTSSRQQTLSKFNSKPSPVINLEIPPPAEHLAHHRGSL